MLTQQRLRQLIEYNPETGIAIWRLHRGGRATVGSAVGFIQRGSKRSHPYRYIYLKRVLPGSKPFTHFVHLYMTGEWPPAEMDHINGNTLDDRWSNLRASSRAQNEANRAVRKNNKLGVKGVFQVKGGRYRAKFWRGKNISVGIFDDPNAAKIALSAAMKAYDEQFFRP